MNISSINQTSNIYSRSVSMKAKMTPAAALKNFNNVLKSNNIVINAQYEPAGNGSYNVDVTLAKTNQYFGSNTTINDSDGYPVCANGKNISEALINLMRSYSGQNLYATNDSSSPALKMPNCIV